jgi:hypothetical protein
MNKRLNPNSTPEDYLPEEDYLENFYFDDGDCDCDDYTIPYESAMEP